MPRLDEDALLLFDAVREAGALALGYFRNSPAAHIKADGTQVSEADLAADRLLSDRLKAARPDYGWLSEETPDDGTRHSRQRVWMADPIDGTRAFLKGVAEWTVCAALVEEGVPRVGAIFNPATDEFFHAVEGGGAFLNGKSISVSGAASIEGSRLAITDVMLKRSYWGRPWPTVSTRWVNSIAYRLALVASGRSDGTMSLSKKSLWDLAAAHLLVQEAGGVFTTHDGGTLRFDHSGLVFPSVVAAGPKLHAALLERTREVEVTKDGPRARTGH
ncbi:MAG: 3'(2'),5'-bisphosphate nucleotidase CysQ [Pseudomonadota bacterium]|nr:3'(2'),5'-bisphosphate nucleotidase CysQ [Pseudomonadota bacterium]